MRLTRTKKLEKAKVKEAGPQKLLTNIISLIRFAGGENAVLEPFPDMVNHRFETWLAQQKLLRKNFTPEQVE